MADTQHATGVAAEIARQYGVRYLVGDAVAYRPGPLETATPDDIARRVTFSLVAENGYSAGQTIFVCGGTGISGTGGQ
jgi:hypothetical protein